MHARNYRSILFSTAHHSTPGPTRIPQITHPHENRRHPSFASCLDCFSHSLRWRISSIWTPQRYSKETWPCSPGGLPASGCILPAVKILELLGGFATLHRHKKGAEPGGSAPEIRRYFFLKPSSLRSAFRWSGTARVRGPGSIHLRCTSCRRCSSRSSGGPSGFPRPGCCS